MPRQYMLLSIDNVHQQVLNQLTPGWLREQLL